MPIKTLVVHKISYFNAVLFYLLSFFWRIKTLAYRDTRVKDLIGSRVQLLDWNDYGDNEVINKYGLEVSVPTWSEKISLIDVDGSFKITVNSYEVDVSEKIRKDLGSTFQHYYNFLKFKSLEEEYINGLDIYLINKYTDFTVPRSPYLFFRLISRLNILFEHFEAQTTRTIRLCQGIKRLISSLWNGSKQFKQTPIVLEALNSSEISLEEENLSFTSLLQDTDLQQEEVLFLLHLPIPEAITKKLDELGIQYAQSVLDLGCMLSKTDYFNVVMASAYSFIRTLLGLFKISAANETYLHHPRLVCWSYLSKTLKVKTYVNSLSHGTFANYDVLLLNEMQINTVMYNFSANSMVTTKNIEIDPFHLSYSRILHKFSTVWTKSYAQEVQKKYRGDFQIKVTGPVMAAKAQFTEEDIETFRRKYIGTTKASTIYIGAFDIAPQAKGWAAGLLAYVPSIYSEDFCSTFIEDIERLTQEDLDIVILYKAKRDTLNATLDRYAGILKRTKKNPQWITLNTSVNPWISILLSDIVVGIPFTSICIAAHSKSIPFLYHNAGYTVRFPITPSLSPYMSHSYDSLYRKINLILEKKLDYKTLSQEFCEKDSVHGFNQKFVDFLRNPKGDMIA